MAIKVSGRDLLRQKLAKLPTAIKEKLQEDISKSADDLADVIRSRVHVKSGATRDSVKVERFSKGEIGAIITAGGKSTSKPVRSGQTATYDYAIAEEFGTQDMLAQPFFYPSLRQQRTKIRRNATKAVKAAIQKVAPAPTT